MPIRDEGFLHALQQEPQDDALRLVYADFLEDQGDEVSTAHAQLVRTQVKLAALSPLAPDAAEQAANLGARQNELLARWGRIIVGEWADALHGWTFRRGLVEAVQADASAFLEHASEWFAVWPTLSAARLTQVREHLPELAASPWLAHLRGLDLRKNEIDATALAHLTESRFICLLRALDLRDNPIGPHGVELLGNARYADELCELHLARCGLWHHGLMALLGGLPSVLARWRRLDLSGNGLNRLCLVRLVDSPLMRNLEALDLANNPLGSNGASVLADSPNAARLVDLGLCDTESGDAEVAALAGSRNLANVRSLDLRGHHCLRQVDYNGQEAGGLAELARSPLLGQLRRLLLGPAGPSNGWTTQVLSGVRPPRPPERVRGWGMSARLRNSRYLIPSQLVECDLEELWWLGDTRNRERPLSAPWVAGWLEEFHDLLDRMDRRQVAVLRMRYGPVEGRKGLKEIGEQLGLSPEHVRDIENQAVRVFSELVRAIPSE